MVEPSRKERRAQALHKYKQKRKVATLTSQQTDYCISSSPQAQTLLLCSLPVWRVFDTESVGADPVLHQEDPV